MRVSPKDIAIVIALVLLYAAGSRAATYYVDQTLGTDCTGGDYSIASRNCSGSDGVAYNTIQETFAAISVGDVVYLRGGNYTEDFGDSLNAVELPALNGSGWGDGNFTTVASYPGEWAKIDSNYAKDCAFGHVTTGNGSGTDDRRYWKIERLEITGGTHAGLGIYNGPLWLRYCYIHDNYDGANINDASDVGTPAGLYTYRLKNSIIEYNWFYNNGGDDRLNQNHVTLFNDYQDCWSTVDLSFTGRSEYGNVFRYNLLTGETYGAFHQKGNGGNLTDPANPTLTNEALRDQFHHNLILNGNSSGERNVQLRQSFVEFDHNIVDPLHASATHSYVFLGEEGSSTKMQVYQSGYNNTLIDAMIGVMLPYGSATACGITYPLESYTPVNYLANNIVSSYTSANYYVGVSDGGSMDDVDVNTLDANSTEMVSNLFYYPGNSDHILLGDTLTGVCDSDENGCSVSDFNSLYGMLNYTSSTAGLFVGSSGADKYIPVASFSVGGGTISDVGDSGGHAVLTVNRPSAYVGAVNPNDNDWVNGVFTDLANITWLQSVVTDRDGNDDPTWIEGGAGSAPSYVSSTIDNLGTTLTVTFNSALTQGVGYNNSDVDIDCSVTGNNLALTYTGGDGTSSHTFTIASAVQDGETCNFDFNGDTDSLENSGGTDLAAVVDGIIDNNSGQGASANTGRAVSYRANGNQLTYDAGGYTLVAP